MSAKIVFRSSVFQKSLRGHIESGVYGDEVCNKRKYKASTEISVRLGNHFPELLGQWVWVFFYRDLKHILPLLSYLFSKRKKLQHQNWSLSHHKLTSSWKEILLCDRTSFYWFKCIRMKLMLYSCCTKKHVCVSKHAFKIILISCNQDYYFLHFHLKLGALALSVTPQLSTVTSYQPPILFISLVVPWCPDCGNLCWQQV